MKILRMALLALVPVIVAAQQPAPGSIQGIVVKLGTNDPLANAMVELLRTGSSSIPTTTTGPDGTFVFPKVLPGTYRVAATRDGYVRSLFGQRKLGSPSLTFAIAAGERAPDVRIEMAQGGVISGRINDNGQPVGMAHVFALRSTYNDGLRTMTPVLSARTDDRGEYSIFWLPPGKYYVAAIVFDVADSGTYGLVFMNPNVAGDSSISRRISTTAVLNRAIGSGAGDDQMHVPMYFPSTQEWKRATPIDVQPGAEIRNVNIDASPIPVWRVRGTVTGITPITSASGQRVQPEMYMSRTDLPFPLINMPGSVSVEVGPGGSFDVPRVPPGPYRLIVSQPGGNGGHVFIDVRDRDVNGVNIVMNPMLSVSGRIAIEPQIAASSGLAVTNFSVRIRQDPPRSTTWLATPRSDGSFDMGQNSLAIQAGDYRVSVETILMPPTAPGNTSPTIPQALRNAYVKSIRMGEVDVLNDGLRLRGQRREELVVVIGTNPGALEGRVVDDRQQPVAASTVVLIPDGGIRFRVDHRFTSTDATGRFQMPNVPPGDYKLFAWEAIESQPRAWQDPDFVRAYESRGKPVHIDEGGKVTVEVSSIP